jgi:hypothetical protein
VIIDILSWFNFFGHWVEGLLTVNCAEATDVGANLSIIVLRRGWIEDCWERNENKMFNDFLLLKFKALLTQLGGAFCAVNFSIYHAYSSLSNSPKCLERQNLTARIVDAIMCIFSKLTRPSTLVLLPSCANVISFNSNGINGITGGWSFPTDILLRQK